jgi:tetratricopeptide (TPR) repeat protein
MGQGGMGTVWRAYDRLAQSMVAVKQVVRDAFGDEPRLALAREFRTLSTLRHPHIISVLDYGFDSGKPFLVMPLLEDSQPIGRHRLNWAGIRVEDALVQILLALTYLHRRGIVHCDLKPSNVLICSDRLIRLIDFGIASESMGKTPSAVTLRYLAPELIAGAPVSPAADLYSLGILAYELFTGGYPYDGSSAYELAPQILYEEPNLSGLPVSIAEVVSRLLLKRPGDRYASAIEALFSLCEACEIEVPAETADLRESFLQAARFVGREGELDLLTQRMAKAKTGCGGILVIGGESGVGKSRLVDEIRTIALCDGFRVTRGQAVSTGGLAFQIWREALPPLLMNTPVDSEDAVVLRLAVPQIEILTGLVLNSDDPVDSAMQFPRVLASFLMRIREPVLILLEDLQWAHETIPILQDIVTRLSKIPVLILCTYRDDEFSTLPENLAGPEYVSLSRLSEVALSELAHSILGPRRVDAEFLKALSQQTEGNVFFVVEIMRELAENAGSLAAIRDVPEASVMTGGMKEILHNRLRKVPDWARPLLDLTAIAGRHLDMAIVRKLAGDRFQVDVWLTVCAEVALLDVSPEGLWRFAHDKIREAILESIPDDIRTTLHRTVARAIDDIYGDNPAYASIAAQHWSDAGDPPSAAGAALRAEAYLRRKSAHKDAQHMLRYVLARLDDDVVAEYSVPLYLALGERHVELGEFREARECYQHGLRLAESQGITSGLARGPLGLAYIEWRTGSLEHAFRLFCRVLEIEDADILSRARALNFLGGYHVQNREFSEAERCYREAELECLLVENREGLLLTKGNKCYSYYLKGDIYAGLEAGQEACVLARHEGNALAEAGSLINVTLCLCYLSRYDEAEQTLRQFEKIVERQGDRFLSAFGVRTRAILSQHNGDYASATAQYINAIQAFEALGAINETAHTRFGLIHNWCLAREFSGIELQLRSILDETRVVGSSELKVISAYAAVLAAASTGYTAIARKWYPIISKHKLNVWTRYKHAAELVEVLIAQESFDPVQSEGQALENLFEDADALFYEADLS